MAGIQQVQNFHKGRNCLAFAALFETAGSFASRIMALAVLRLHRRRGGRGGVVRTRTHGDHVKDKWGVDNEGTRVRGRSKCPQPPVT